MSDKENKPKKTHEKIGGIKFILSGCAKMTRKNFDILYGDEKDSKGKAKTYWELKATARDRVWESLQKVLVDEGYKTAKETKES